MDKEDRTRVGLIREKALYVTTVQCHFCVFMPTVLRCQLLLPFLLLLLLCF